MKASDELRRLRAKYPFRLVIDKDKSPKPTAIDTPDKPYGEFGYHPMRDGNEWLFLTDEARARFQAKFGGTTLG